MSGLSRRSFIRRASGVLAAVAVPLFIPSDRLEFGVPRGLLAPEPPAVIQTESLKIIGGEVSFIESFLEIPAAGAPRIQVQESDDGRIWRDVRTADLRSGVVCAPVTARFARINSPGTVNLWGATITVRKPGS